MTNNWNPETINAMDGQYVVNWSMPFDAESAEDAALQAYATLQDPHNTATCFVVETDEGEREVVDVEGALVNHTGAI